MCRARCSPVNRIAMEPSPTIAAAIFTGQLRMSPALVGWAGQRRLASSGAPGGGSRRLARDGWRGAVADGGQRHDGAGEREQRGDAERVVEAVQVGGLGWIAAAE